MTTDTPSALQYLSAFGYEWTHETGRGLCYEKSTAYIEVDPQAGTLKGWLWDPFAEAYIQDSCKLMPYDSQYSLVYGLERMRVHLEGVAEEDALSSTLKRTPTPSFETLSA